jgi:oligoendopeptidase F
MANALATGVKQDVFVMRARGYRSSLEASLASNFIPVEIFHNLIDTFRRHLPTWHRYWRVRRRMLGYDTLREYDVKAPLTASPPHVPYETAVGWIAEGMRPLGDEYVSVLTRGATTERWVDAYPNVGKRMGAFSSGVPGTHPFIMMSYNDDLAGLSTLAHELGHSMHSYYTFATQPLMAYSRYGLFLAEVASNFNQALVRDHLFRTQADPGFQIALIEEAMGNFHRYFFIMPTLARFELEIHERVEKGQALTASSLNGLMAELFAEGYGDELTMDAERTGITWAQFHTHLYSNFYVYQYATGIAAAHALAEGILAGRPGAAERYLAFLKAGGSQYPLDTLRAAGVDMATPEPVESAFAVLSGLVDRLEALAGPSCWTRDRSASSCSTPTRPPRASPTTCSPSTTATSSSTAHAGSCSRSSAAASTRTSPSCGPPRPSRRCWCGARRGASAPSRTPRTSRSPVRTPDCCCCATRPSSRTRSGEGLQRGAARLPRQRGTVSEGEDDAGTLRER